MLFLIYVVLNSYAIYFDWWINYQIRFTNIKFSILSLKAYILFKEILLNY